MPEKIYCRICSDVMANLLTKKPDGDIPSGFCIVFFYFNKG